MADEIGTTEAGAAPVTTTAEASGQVSTTTTDNTTGAEPGTVAAESQGGQEGQPTTQEGAEGATEGSTASPDKGAHQKTLEERVQELAEKRITEEAQKLRMEFQQATQAKAAEKPNFYEIDFDKVNDHIRGTMDQIEELKLEGKYLEAMELQDGLTGLRQELKANEQRKGEYLQKTQAQQQNTEYEQAYNKALDDAAAFYFPKKGYTPEVIEEGRKFFIGECQKDALLAAKYREVGHVQGPLAAMEFAESFIKQNMGKKEQELIDKKEAAKTTLPPGKTSTGEVIGNSKLAELREKANSGNASDLAAYMAEKNRAAATA
jgi:hypothetical protein